MPTVESEEPFWYCIWTRPKQENKVAQLLRKEMNLEVFAPRLRFRRPRKDVPIWVTEALFPNYLFVRCCYPQQSRQIAATAGVVGFVKFGQQVNPLADALIAEIRAHVTDEETIEIAREPHVGEEIVIASGPYAGVRALVSRIFAPRQRIAILLEILGQTREIEIEAPRTLPSNPRIFL